MIKYSEIICEQPILQFYNVNFIEAEKLVLTCHVPNIGLSVIQTNTNLHCNI